MEKQTEHEKKYNQHLEYMSQIAIDDGIYKITDLEIDKAYEHLIDCLPNNGRLYKYRNFKQEGFEKSYASLLEGYIWLASPCLMNDKIDTTLKINMQLEKRKIEKYLNNHKYVLLKKWLNLLFENNGTKIPLSNDDVYQIVNCYTKQGRVIKTKIRLLLRRYGIPYNKLDLMVKQVVDFVEENSVRYESVVKDITEKFININADMRNKQRLFCIAESPLIDSMWAYYGDDNKGFCIEYDFSKGKYLNADIKRVLLNLFKVKYRNKRGAFSFVDMIEELILNDKQNYHSIVKINRRIFEQVLTKGKDWQHEKEWRIVVSTEINRFDVDLVSSIYIDAEMIDTEEGKLLLGLAKQKQWPIYKRGLNSLRCEYQYSIVE